MSAFWSRALVILTLAAVLTLAPENAALASTSAYPRGSHHYSSSTHHTSRYTVGVERDKNGRIKRSEAAKMRFFRQTGYPHGRPGYVVDHIVPLSKGGKDDPSNMQWQTKSEAKAKDKTERKCTSSTTMGLFGPEIKRVFRGIGPAGFAPPA